MRKYCSIILFLAIMLVTGCSINSQLESDLSANRQTLSYLYNSKISLEKKNVSVQIDSVLMKDNAMRSNTKVTKISELFLPFIFFNSYQSKHLCELGKNVLNEDISSFVLNSMRNEANRSGIFNVNSSDSINGSNYKLLLEIDSLSVDGLYSHYEYMTYTVYYIYIGELESADYPNATCKLHYTLLKDDKAVWTNNIESSTRNLVIMNRGSKKTFRHRYAIAIAEALSQSINQSLIQVVNELNNYITIKEPDLITIKTITQEELAEVDKMETIEAVKTRNPDFSYFYINDDSIIEGKLCEIRKKEICVAYNQTFIKINKKRLVKIENYLKEDITATELAREEFPRLNFNRFNEFKTIK